MKMNRQLLRWIPVLLIWASFTLILLATGSRPMQRTLLHYNFFPLLLNITALLSGMVLLVESFRLHWNKIPLIVYTLGLLGCWTFGVH